MIVKGYHIGLKSTFYGLENALIRGMALDLFWISLCSACMCVFIAIHHMVLTIYVGFYDDLWDLWQEYRTITPITENRSQSC